MNPYAIARRVFLEQCRKAREEIANSRSGAVIHSAEIDLRYSRDQLVWIRRNRKESA